MGQNILPCIVWKNTKESEHLTQIPKPHLSTWGVITLIQSLYAEQVKNVTKSRFDTLSK